jgi:6-phosphofructokinase 1
MADLVGNLLVAQSGGPTAVINASVAGVVQEAGKHPDLIEEIYGGLNGILGILNEDLIDLQEEKRLTIESLKHTPGAALGTCRYKINFKKQPARAAADMDRLFQVLQAHNIRYFLYVGGNDSQDTALHIHEAALERRWDMRVIGVPKTIDNDLPHTDHCPGYGSVIKYNAATVMEIGADVASMATDDGACCIIEVMGRSAGWIAAGTVLAKRSAAEAPHLILLPEIPFEETRVLARIKEVVAALQYCVVVVGEGTKDTKGVPLGANPAEVDAFEHTLFSGAGEYLAAIVNQKLETKTRTVKLGYAQRCAMHFASATDVEEAVACCEKAVQAAVAGQSGYMVKLVRESNQPYHCSFALQDLKDVANIENDVPRKFLAEDGFLPNDQFIEYARPLVEGEIRIPLLGGLPRYAILDRARVEKKLAPRAPTASE